MTPLDISAALTQFKACERQTQEAWRGVREVAPFGGWSYVPEFWFKSRAVLVVTLSFALVIAVLVLFALNLFVRWRSRHERA